MNFPLFIARRYFLSKRKKNFINFISLISMAGVAFATAALIIVLSVFNGLEDLLRSLNTSFDPELKIEPTRGKTFLITDSLLSSVKSVPGVKIVTEVIEDYAYVRYRDAEIVVTLKGVSENFLEQHRLDDHIIDGTLKLYQDSIPFCIVGRGVRYILSADVNDNMASLQMFYVKDIKRGTFDASSMYAKKSIRPSAVFSIEKSFDENYIFVPLKFAQDLMGFTNKRTSLEVLTDGNHAREIQQSIKKILGENFSVLTNEEQHKDLYKLLKFEKLFIFFSLSVLMLVGAINVFFSLMMLAIDKKKDVSILFAMGAPPSFIKRVFLMEGAIISFLGAGTGLSLGAILCILQDKVGLVGMGMENAIVSNYPVKMDINDFIMTGLMVTFVAFLVSTRPAVLASRSYSIEQL
jgi:lipoprotein-releasing system permease protein